MALQYGPTRERGYRPFISLGMLALVLTIWQHKAWDVGQLSLPEYLAYAFVTALERPMTAVLNTVRDCAIALVKAPQLVAENRNAEEMLDEIEAERLSAFDIRKRDLDIQRKLGLDLDQPFDKIAARVIARSSGGESRWVRIRTAGDKPLEAGNTVREALGLVGRVADAKTGRVMLLTDPDHAVRARDQASGEEGMVRAAPEPLAGPNRLRLEKVQQGGRLSVGDVIMTSELGETYPGGIPIGVIESVRSSSTGTRNAVAYIRPFVDFDRLDYVYVLRLGAK